MKRWLIALIITVLLAPAVLHAKERVLVLSAENAEICCGALDSIRSAIRSAKEFDPIDETAFSLVKKRINRKVHQLGDGVQAARLLGASSLLWVEGWTDYQTVFQVLRVDVKTGKGYRAKGVMLEADFSLRESMIKGTALAALDRKLLMETGFLPEPPAVDKWPEWVLESKGPNAPKQYVTSILAGIDYRGKVRKSWTLQTTDNYHAGLSDRMLRPYRFEAATVDGEPVGCYGLLDIYAKQTDLDLRTHPGENALWGVVYVWDLNRIAPGENEASKEAEYIKAAARHGNAKKRSLWKPCVLDAMKKNPDLTGGFRLGLLLDPKGEVKDIEKQYSSFTDPDVEKCLLTQIRKWNFPAGPETSEKLVVPLDYGVRASKGETYRGRQEGNWTYWHENGRVKAQGEFRKDRKVGLWTTWYDNGEKKAEGIFLKDRAHGVGVRFYKNGQKKEEGQFHKGYKTGEWTFWHANGQIRAKGSFKRGRKTDEWVYWYENGKIKMAGPFKKDLPTGPWNLFHENGQMRAQGEFKKGKQTGLWIFYDETGAEVERSEYRKGKKIE